MIRNLFERVTKQPDMPKVEEPVEKSPVTLYTIGHGSKKWDEFLGQLKEAGIQIVFDLRDIGVTPRANHYRPQGISKIKQEDGIGARLSKAGIGYEWYWLLGNTQESLDAYKDWLNSDNNANIVLQLLILTIRATMEDGLKMALLSTKTSPDKEHRRVIAETIAERFHFPSIEVEIVHL